VGSTNGQQADKSSMARAGAIAEAFAALPQVTAVALAGSQAAEASDPYSDLDLYIYSGEELALEDRGAIARRFADPQLPVELNKPFWGPEDAWTDRISGLAVDLVYWSPRWIEEQVERALIHHQGSVGYSTSFWYTVQRSQPLFDREGWFARLKQSAAQPYPEPLRRSILRLNYPVLRKIGSSYRHQLELAILRRDRISIGHRITALLASYFDVIFAVNRVPNPGEKRLLALAGRLCPSLPLDMDVQVNDLLLSIGSPWEAQYSLAAADVLLNSLDRWLLDQGLITQTGEVIEQQ
jgi:predicted nucleotidyltransferase